MNNFMINTKVHWHTFDWDYEVARPMSIHYPLIKILLILRESIYVKLAKWWKTKSSSYQLLKCKKKINHLLVKCTNKYTFLLPKHVKMLSPILVDCTKTSKSLLPKCTNNILNPFWQTTWKHYFTSYWHQQFVQLMLPNSWIPIFQHGDTSSHKQ